MKILIIGSQSYLGSRLYDCFKNKYEVRAIDIRKEPLDTITDHFDIVINCIGRTPDKAVYSYIEYEVSNLDVVKLIFNWFVKSSSGLFIHFSSISAVEEHSSTSVLTEDAPCNPISDYGITKRLAEEFLLSQKIDQSKNIIILRPTRIHGPGEKGTIRKLYQSVLRGTPFPFGNYYNHRSFLTLKNLYFILEKIFECYPRIESGIYNIADDKPLSTVDIIKLIEQSTGKKIRILNIPKNVINALGVIGNVLKLPINTSTIKKITSSRVISNNKIKRLLEIDKLPVSSDEGMLETVESFKNS